MSIENKMETSSKIKPFWLTEELVSNTTLKFQRLLDDYEYLTKFYPVVKTLQEVDYRPQRDMINKLWDLKEKYFRTRSAKLIGFPIYQDMHRRVLDLKETLTGKTYMQIYRCMVIKDYREAFSFKKLQAKDPEKAQVIFKIHKLIFDSVSESNEKANSVIDMSGLSEIDFAYFKLMEISEVKKINDQRRFNEKIKITLWNKFQKEEFQWMQIFIKLNRLKENFIEFINGINHDREGIPDEPIFKSIKSILEYAHQASSAPIPKDKKPVVIKPLRPGQDLLMPLPNVESFNYVRIKPGEIQTEDGTVNYFNQEVNIDVENENDLMIGTIDSTEFVNKVKGKVQERIKVEVDKMRKQKRKAQKENSERKEKEFEDMLDSMLEDELF